jgi:NADH-quinone oxidoreductase subunit C
MPSSQAPLPGSTAVDPTAVRPEIADARIVRVTPSEVRATLEGLKRDGFALLLDVGGADYPGREPRFDVVYHLVKLSANATTPASIGSPERVRVLCGVPEAEAVVPTVSDLWPCANWAEREVFDLFGVRFEGHPDLRRIQMPVDWVGHPLRKDYPLRGPAREKSPRPSFALKSNVAAGTPAAGRTAAGLQRQIAAARGQTVKDETKP